jgi:hypothetical protein
MYRGKISSLPRSLDMDRPDNRVIIFLCAVVFIVSIFSRIMSGDHPVQGVIWGGKAALSIFFAWALAKEIDPDNPGSALIASVLGLSALFLFNNLSLLAALLLLFLFRMTSRTVGVPLALYDSILILLMGIYLVYTGEWMYGIIMSIAFIMDATLKKPVRRHFFFAIVSIVSGLLGFSINSSEIVLRYEYYISAILILVLFFIFRILLAGQTRSLSDRSGQRLSDKRIIATCIVALGAGLLVIPGGSTAITAVFPLWAAMGGSVAVDIVQRMR